jgi:alkanesulfonate monooxygenase SsuD/methylene tetrahydromethanopterin reductase-like flavin-dependent oxidoreductase (luciferase family)
MTRATFGWITQIAAKDGVDPDSLFETNLSYIRELKPPFDTLWFEDHLQWSDTAVLESWTALTTMAALFPNMRCGTLVLSQSFRNPAHLAKMSASLQKITAGRLIVGIGAGWKEDEYKAYGFPFPSNKQRLEQLEETAIILKKMWHESPATFHGKHYSIEGAYCVPQPAPIPPLMIGGGGEKVTLKLVAKYADWMNLLFADLPTFLEKDGVLKRHCEDVGRDSDAIKRTLYAYVFLTPDGRKPAPRSGDKYVIYGDADRVGEQISGFVDAGVEHFMLRFLDFPSVDGATLFQSEVIPKL